MRQNPLTSYKIGRRDCQIFLGNISLHVCQGATADTCSSITRIAQQHNSGVTLAWHVVGTDWKVQSVTLLSRQCHARLLDCSCFFVPGCAITHVFVCGIAQP